MAKTKSVIKKVDSSKWVASRYDMSMENMVEIYEQCKDSFDIMHYSFVFGYIQGMKAERAKRKQGAINA